MTKADVMMLPCKTSTDRAVVAIMLALLDSKFPDKHKGADFNVRVNFENAMVQVKGRIPVEECKEK